MGSFNLYKKFVAEHIIGCVRSGPRHYKANIAQYFTIQWVYRDISRKLDLYQMPEEYIGDRLKRLIDENKVQRAQVVRATGINESTLRAWESGTGIDTFLNQIKLRDYLDDIENKTSSSIVEEGKVNYETQFRRSLLIRIPLKGKGGPLPYENPTTNAGTTLIIEKDPELIVYRIEAPYLGHIDGVIKVIGHDMEPTYRDRQRIGIIKLKNYKIFDPGKCYFIIDENLGGRVKRVYYADNGINLVSDNIDQNLYPPVKLEWDNILAIFKVVDLS